MNREPAFRTATQADLPEIIALLSDDLLGETRESPDPAPYAAAFAEIEASPDNEVIVAEFDGRLAGVLQLTIIPNLSRAGAKRGQIEGVRIRREFRDRGVGAALVRHAIDRARARGCTLVQLTTDKRRPEALRFYESLGLEATHEGMKMGL